MAVSESGKIVSKQDATLTGGELAEAAKTRKAEAVKVCHSWGEGHNDLQPHGPHYLRVFYTRLSDPVPDHCPVYGRRFYRTALLADDSREIRYFASRDAAFEAACEVAKDIGFPVDRINTGN